MSPPRRQMGMYVAVGLAAVAVYSNTLDFGAAWDDTRFVFESGARGGIGAAPDLLTAPFLADLPAGRSPYRPFTAISYALDWSLGGGQAAFFHWTNVALHAVNSVLVAALVTALGAGPMAAGAAGAVFAVHPVHSEAVANLAGRGELLVALALLSASIVFLRGVREGREDLGFGRGALILVLFAVGLGAKENAVVLPGLLAVLALLRPADARGPVARVLEPWPLWLGTVVVAAGYMLARHAVLGTFTTHDVAPFILPLPASTRIATAVANWSEYARLMVFPLDLVVDYGPAVIRPSTPTQFPFWAGLSVGAGVAVLSALAWRSTRLPALGLAWFAVAVSPVSNLVVPIAQWLAERFLYLPSVGFSVAIAGVWMVVQRRATGHGRSLSLTLAAATVLLLTARTWSRNATWRDTETVAATLMTEHPEAFRSQWLMGSALLEAGQIDAGIAALGRARDLNPNAIEIHLELAEWHLRLGRVSEARSVLEALPSGRHPGRDALLSRALQRLGRPAAADSVAAQGLARFPRNAELIGLLDSLRASAPSR